MNINFYQYTLMDSSTYSNAAYMAYQYANEAKLGSVGGQTTISINYDIPCVSDFGTFSCPQEDSSDEWGFMCNNAVSYTHLDVYKRQV